MIGTTMNAAGPGRSPFLRSFRQPCRRCGREVAGGPARVVGGGALCAGCMTSDLARAQGMFAGNYSPFRSLTGPA